MGKSSAQPAHTPDIDVCPFLGRESAEQDGAPIPLNLPRDGGGDLRPSPVFRCLALPDGARIDAGRQRRLCLSARHTACRRYGDAEDRGALPASATPTPTPISTADLTPEEDETDARIGRIRRRYGNRGQETNAPRAQVTVAGRPVDFTPMDDPQANPTETRRLNADDAQAEADRLGTLWDDHVELDRLGASQTSDPAEESDAGVAPAQSAGDALTDAPGAGFDMPTADRPATAGPADTTQAAGAGDGAGQNDDGPLGGDAWQAADPDTMYSVNPPLGDDAWADPGADRDESFDSARESGFERGSDDDTGFGDDATHGAEGDRWDDGAQEMEREFREEDEADWEREPVSPPGPAPSARASGPQTALAPLAAAVSGALGGLGAAGGGDRRGRLMGIAGVLLIVVGIVSAVLAVVVGFNKSGDPTAPIVAAEADVPASTPDESASVAATTPSAEAPTAEVPAAAAAAATEDAGAAPARTGSVPPVDTPESSAGSPAPERTGSVPPANDSDPSSTPDAATETETPTTPDGTVETAPTPDAVEETVIPVVESGPDEASADGAVVDFEVPDGPAPDYGWVSYWPETEVHAIAPGDTISSLAAQFDTHAYAITCLNTRFWSDSQRTFTMIVGTSLVIPVGYTIPGDDQTLFQYLQTGFLLRRCG